jgi:hypothetical protein
MPARADEGRIAAARVARYLPRGVGTRLADVDALVDHVTTIGDQLTGVPPG